MVSLTCSGLARINVIVITNNYLKSYIIVVENPASLTNGGLLMDEEGRKKTGITDAFIRLR